MKMNEMSINSLPPELMERIFSYLTLKEAFCYETVCKKWQQLIFNSQMTLDVNDLLSQYNYEYGKAPNIPNYDNFKEWLQMIFKKCPNIKKIDASGYYLKADEIQVITDLCPNLDDINLNRFGLLSNSEEERNNAKEAGEAINYLATKYGPQLKRSNWVFDAHIMKRLCPCLQEISDFIYIFKDEENVPQFPELIKSGATIFNKKDFHFFCSFIQFYYNQLKSLKLMFDNGFDREEGSFPFIKNSLKEVAKCYHLEKLTIDSLFFDDMKEGLIYISKTCIHIKQIHVYITSDIKSIFDFSVFGLFKELNELKVGTKDHENCKKCFNKASIDQLSNCKNLRKLILYVPLDYNTFLANILLFLPQLTFIKLTFSYEKIGFIDTTLHSLAQLKMLNTIILRSYPKNLITDTGVCDVINSCQSIRRMEFFLKIKITVKTLRKLVHLASFYPAIQYTFSYESYDECITQYLQNNKIPSNLKLIHDQGLDYG